MTGFLRASGTEVGIHFGAKQFCKNMFDQLPRRLESANALAGTRFATMPNPRLCRIDVLKPSGNCANPADSPSCHSAPCGIVRCASQESQRSPSARLTSSLPFGELHRRAGQLHLQGWFPGRSRILRQRVPWANPILACSIFRLFPRSAGARLCRMTRIGKGSGY